MSFHGKKWYHLKIDGNREVNLRYEETDLFAQCLATVPKWGITP